MAILKHLWGVFRTLSYLATANPGEVCFQAFQGGMGAVFQTAQRVFFWLWIMRIFMFRLWQTWIILWILRIVPFVLLVNFLTFPYMLTGIQLMGLKEPKLWLCICPFFGSLSYTLYLLGTPQTHKPAMWVPAGHQVSLEFSSLCWGLDNGSAQ